MLSTCEGNRVSSVWSPLASTQRPSPQNIALYLSMNMDMVYHWLSYPTGRNQNPNSWTRRLLHPSWRFRILKLFMFGWLFQHMEQCAHASRAAVGLLIPFVWHMKDILVPMRPWGVSRSRHSSIARMRSRDWQVCPAVFTPRSRSPVRLKCQKENRQ